MLDTASNKKVRSKRTYWWWVYPVLQLVLNSHHSECLLILVPGIDVFCVSSAYQLSSLYINRLWHEQKFAQNPEVEQHGAKTGNRKKGHMCFRRQILVRFKWNSIKGLYFWFWSSMYQWNRKVEGKFRILEHHQNRFRLYSSAPLRFWTYHPISIRVELSELKSN